MNALQLPPDLDRLGAAWIFPLSHSTSGLLSVVTTSFIENLSLVHSQNRQIHNKMANRGSDPEANLSLEGLISKRLGHITTKAEKFVEPFRSRAMAEISVQCWHINSLRTCIENPSSPLGKQDSARKELFAILEAMKTPDFYLELPSILSDTYDAIEIELRHGDEMKISRDTLERMAQGKSLHMAYVRTQYLTNQPQPGIPPKKGDDVEKVRSEGNLVLQALRRAIQKHKNSFLEAEGKETRCSSLSMAPAAGQKHNLTQSARSCGGGEEAAIVTSKKIKLDRSELQSPNADKSAYYLGNHFIIDTPVNNMIAHIAAINYVSKAVPGGRIDPKQDIGITLKKAFLCDVELIDTSSFLQPVNGQPPTTQQQAESGTTSTIPRVHHRGPEIAVKVPFILSYPLKSKILGLILGTDWQVVFPKHLTAHQTAPLIAQLMSRENRHRPTLPDYRREKNKWFDAISIPVTTAVLWQIGLDRVFTVGNETSSCAPTAIHKVKKRLQEHYGIYLVEEGEQMPQGQGMLISRTIAPGPGMKGRILCFDQVFLKVGWGVIFDRQVCRWYRAGYIHVDSPGELTTSDVLGLLQLGSGPNLPLNGQRPWLRLDIIEID